MTDQQPTIEQQAQGIALRKAILRLTETAEYLGHRVEALEVAARRDATAAAKKPTFPAFQVLGASSTQEAPTPPLVKRVSAAVNRTHIGEIDGIARAAIRVMAGELRAQCFVHAADWLDAQSDQ